MSKKIELLTAVIGLSIFFSACQSPATNNNENVKSSPASGAAVSQNAGTPAKQETPAKTYKVNLSETSEPIQAGKPAKLIFSVSDNGGNIVKDFKIVHEKLMHLLIVSEDLAFFDHQHPNMQENGSFVVDYTFKNGGNYRLYADITPENAPQYVESISLNVQGAPGAAAELKADNVTEKTVDGIKVKMTSDSEISSGKDLMLDFSVNDAKTGKPVTNLQNYLGELAHFVIISRDLKNFVHAHPMSKQEHSAQNGAANNSTANNSTANKNAAHNADGHQHSANTNTNTNSVSEVVNTVSAHVNFPTAGLYKIWAQFQRDGKVINVPFVVDVKQGAAGNEKAAEFARPVNGEVRIVVDKNGYKPSNIALRPNEKVKLTFLRADGENCGSEVVFPSLGIKKELPVGVPVQIDLAAAADSKEISFTCGMNMFKGKIVVQ